MGKINRGILGGFSGKVANVVGSSWKGIDVMRSLPLSVANPRTNKQVAVRDSFSNIARFASSILSTWIKPLWDRFAQKQSGYNAFIQANWNVAFEPGAPEFMGQLTASKGKLGMTPITSAIYSTGGKKLMVAWDRVPTGSFQQSTDLAYILIAGQENIVGYAVQEGKRQEAGATIDVPEDALQGETPYWCYLAFAREDGTIVGDSTSIVITKQA